MDRMAVLVEGGVPPQSVVLLSGPPGSGKSSLALQLLADHAKGGGGALLVTTETAPAVVLAREPALRDAPGLHFLDGYSWRTGVASDAPRVTSLPGLADLSTFSIRLSESLARLPEPRLVVFDTASTLALHASSSTVLKFFELGFAKVRASGASMLLAVEKGVHDEAFMTALAYMCDGVVDLKLEDGPEDLLRFVRVRALRTAPRVSSRWARLLLGPQGIELVL